jgi:hypothetical protein
MMHEKNCPIGQDDLGNFKGTAKLPPCGLLRLIPIQQVNELACPQYPTDSSVCLQASS